MRLVSLVDYRGPRSASHMLARSFEVDVYLLQKWFADYIATHTEHVESIGALDEGIQSSFHPTFNPMLFLG